MSELRKAIINKYEQINNYLGFSKNIFIRDYYRNLETIKNIITYCPKDNYHTILDVAAGYSVPCRVLKELYNYNIIAIDSLLSSNDKAINFLNLAFPTVAIWDLESQGLPIKNKSVDVVLFLATIEHLHNSPKFIMEEFYRVLKPGGILIIDTPNILELRKRLMMLLGKSFMPPIQFIYNEKFHFGHHREYTLDDLVKVFTWSNFRIVEAKIIDTLSGLSVIRRISHEKRKYEMGQISQMTQFELGFHALRLYDWATIPFVLFVKLFPNWRDTIVVIGRKE